MDAFQNVGPHRVSQPDGATFLEPTPDGNVGLTAREDRRQWRHQHRRPSPQYVKVLIVHVGGTRCVPSNTDHILNRQARVTWTVACIRTCSFYVFIVCLKTRTSMVQTHLFFSMLLMFRYPADVVATALARGAQPVANASLEQRVRK